MKVFILLIMLLLLTFINISGKKETVRKVVKKPTRPTKSTVPPKSTAPAESTGFLSEFRGPTKTKAFAGRRYVPTWESLDSRPLPEWFDRAKIGIFIHWGVYSVPAVYNEWFWHKWRTEGKQNLIKYMERNFKPNFTYEEFGPFFKAQLFDPHEWARLFAKSGAKYVVLTSKHHDGYTLFPSYQSRGWNSMEVGPHRDLVDELGNAVKLKGLKYGLYYSLYEWYNPDYLFDKANGFGTSMYVNRKLWPDILQLVNSYKPSIIWFDGHWQAPHRYFNTTSILCWLYNDSPVKDYVVVNDRLGSGTTCHHGDFFTCGDRYIPMDLQSHKWETCLSLDLTSWGYRSRMKDYEVMPVNDMFDLMISTISRGGNFLLNIGPTKEGVIVPIFRKRLLALGEWLKTSGEAIYNTSPWFYQRDSANVKVQYTCTKTGYNARNATAVPSKSDTVKAIYALFTEYPKGDVLELKDVVPELASSKYEVSMLGHRNILNWTLIAKGKIVAIQLPAKTENKHAWALKFHKT